MNIDMIAGKLSRLGLIGTEGVGVSLAPAGPLLFVGDDSTGFYADPKAVWSGLKSLSECTPDQFWSRNWLAAPSYDSLAEVWAAWDTPQFDASMKPPRSSDFVSIGRVRPFGATYLIQSENGEYGIVDDKQVGKWRLTPLG